MKILTYLNPNPKGQKCSNVIKIRIVPFHTKGDRIPSWNKVSIWYTYFYAKNTFVNLKTKPHSRKAEGLISWGFLICTWKSLELEWLVSCNYAHPQMTCRHEYLFVTFGEYEVASTKAILLKLFLVYGKS